MNTHLPKSSAVASLKSAVLIIIGIAAITIAGAALYFYLNPVPPIGPGGEAPRPNAKNLTYTIDGTFFPLKNGRAVLIPKRDIGTSTQPGATETRILSMFGEPVYGDLDADNDLDAAVLLAYKSGGSGTFYYAALVILDSTVPGSLSWHATEAVLLGDRIAPQNIEIRDGRAVYNYAVRRADEPMSTAPSVGKSTWIQYDAVSGGIGKWEKEPEDEVGEVGTVKNDSAILTGRKWILAAVRRGETLAFGPKKAGAFSVTFENGKASMTTDCNQMGGNYTVKGNALSFGDLFSTLMYCEGSEEVTFGKYIGAAASYEIVKVGTTGTELRITTKDGAIMYFN